MNALRQDLGNGVAHDSCQRCWTEEKAGKTSLRQIYNSEWQDLVTDPVQDVPVTFDIKLGNLCNLRCVMCHPGSSSRIASERITHQQQFDQLDFLPPLLDRDYSQWPRSEQFAQWCQILERARHLKFTGGEPLINPYLQQVLDQVPNPSQVKINIVTNGTVVNDRLLSRLGEFQEVWFTVSIDALGERYDYIRDGADWLEVEKNLDRFARLSNTIFIVNVTVQYLNAWHLADVIDMIDRRGWRLNPIFLATPRYLSVNSLPDNVKQQALARLRGYHSVSNADQVSSTINFIEQSSHDPHAHEQAQRYLDALDRVRNRRRRDCFPELSGH